MRASIMRYEDGFLPNILAIAYGVLGFYIGIILLTRTSLWANIIGVALTAHSMSICAYLMHECMHGTVFRRRRDNQRLARLLSWISGSCYARLKDLTHMHMKHHTSRADTVSFDYRAFLHEQPAIVRQIVLLLEWAYIPAVDFLMNGYVIARPFCSPQHRDQRKRVIIVFIARSLQLIALALISIKAVLLYFLAYWIFMSVLRLMDVFQHNFEVMSTEAASRVVRSKDYEYEHTYSPLISTRFAALNLLTLNFAYHNAHHAKPAAPWYRLPETQVQAFGPNDKQVLPLAHLLKNYHTYRVRRVMDEECGSPDEKGNINGFVGAVGVSFLADV